MAHVGVSIPSFKEKIAMIWGTNNLKARVTEAGAVDGYTVEYLWLKRERPPSKNKVDAISTSLKLPLSVFNEELQKFADILSATCQISASELFNNMEDMLAKCCVEYKNEEKFFRYISLSMTRDSKASVQRLYARWQGHYYLFHHRITDPDKTGDITRAHLHICGIEHVMSSTCMKVRINWPGIEEYRGIVAIGTNRWYIMAGGTENNHEVVNIITFDPTIEGRFDKISQADKDKLYGILVGFTETDYIPTAVNVVITKMTGTEILPVDNVPPEQVSNEIKERIRNIVDIGSRKYTLQPKCPPYRLARN